MFGLLEEIGIDSSVALLKSFSIPKGTCLPKVLKVFNFKGLFRQKLMYYFVTTFFQLVPANTFTRLTGVRGEFYLQNCPHNIKKLAHIKRFTHNMMKDIYAYGEKTP